MRTCLFSQRSCLLNVHVGQLATRLRRVNAVSLSSTCSICMCRAVVGPASSTLSKYLLTTDKQVPMWRCQVHTGGVVLLAGTTKLQEMLLDDLGAPAAHAEHAGLAASITNPSLHQVAAASIADPYLLLHLTNGAAVLLRANAGEGASPACLEQTSHPALICGFAGLARTPVCTHVPASNSTHREVPCQGCWRDRRSRQRCSPQRPRRLSQPAASTWTPAAGCRPAWNPRTSGSWTTRRRPRAHPACSAWRRAPAGCCRCTRCPACSCWPSLGACLMGCRCCSCVSQVRA